MNLSSPCFTLLRKAETSHCLIPEALKGPDTTGNRCHQLQKKFGGGGGEEREKEEGRSGRKGKGEGAGEEVRDRWMDR